MAKEVTKFLKVREVKSPSRSYPTDAGIDFFVPKFTKDFIETLKEKNEELFKNKDTNMYWSGVGMETATATTTAIDDNSKSKFKFDEKEGMPYFILPPQERVLIPSGIHLRMAQPGRALIAANKSGVASKLGLIFGAQVVDFTYQGEIHINIINTTSKIVKIYEDMKIIQFLETPVITNEIEVADGVNGGLGVFIKFYEGMEKDRGARGFGSTDKKEKTDG